MGNRKQIHIFATIMRFKRQLDKGLVGQRIRAAERTKKFVNLDSARTAGIVWTDHDRKAFERLTELLDQRQIKWTDLCFVDDKTAEKNVHQINKKDFCSHALPKNAVVEDFVNTEFDLLIDISLSPSVCAQAVRGLSRASCKVGWSDATPDFFDLRIDVRKRPEPAFLVEQLTHYLNEIKAK